MRTATVQNDVLTYLENHGRARLVDIRRSFPNYSTELIGATLSGLAKRGKVTKVERGTYVLPGFNPGQSAVLSSDMALLRILTAAVENCPPERRAELLHDLQLAQIQRDRSTLWYAGIAELVKQLEEKL